jgi:uncharacterized protein (TIGR01655 family)
LEKRNNSFKNLICVIFIGILALGVYIGVRINTDPSFIDTIRTSIRTDKYFVKIEQDGKVEKNKGNNPWIYKYETTAYNKRGESIKVSFYADKNFKKGAYICVHVLGTGEKKDVYDVDSFEEVNINNVPKLTKDKLNSK